jgi:hypothetical protein
VAYRRRRKSHEQRLHGRLVEYRGTSARVVFTHGNGCIVAGPAKPFRAASIEPGGWFVMVVRRHPGGELAHADVKRVRPPPSAAQRGPGTPVRLNGMTPVRPRPGTIRRRIVSRPLSSSSTTRR